MASTVYIKKSFYEIGKKTLSGELEILPGKFQVVDIRREIKEDKMTISYVLRSTDNPPEEITITPDETTRYVFLKTESDDLGMKYGLNF